MRMKHKSWSEPFLESHPETIININSDEDVKKLLDKPLALEIGTGRGDFILKMAQKYPEYTWLGIEMNVDALAICAKKIVESGLKNVILVRQNFALIWDFFPSGSISRLHLNFSDPWPKKRHHKRRLTYYTFLRQYKRMLKSDGELILKTDNENLFDFSLESLANENWDIVYNSRDYQFDENIDVMTEYETKFRSLGQPIYRLIAK